MIIFNSLITRAFVSIIFTSLLGCSQEEKRYKSTELATQETRPTSKERKPFFVEGYFENADNTTIVYKQPYDWEPDEYKLGSIKVWNFINKKSDVVEDSIVMDYPQADWLNDSILIVPTTYSFYSYNIYSQKKTILGELNNKNQAIVGFCLNSTKDKIGMLIMDFSEHKVLLKIQSLYKKEDFILEYTITNEETDEEMFSTMYWQADHIIYCIGSSLFSHTPGQKEAFLVTNQLAFSPFGQAYGVSETEVIYFEQDKYTKLILKKMTFENNKIAPIVNNLPEISFKNLNPVLDPFTLYTSKANNRKQVFLEIGNSIYKFVANKWIKENHPSIYSNNIMKVMLTKKESIQGFLIDQ